MSKLLIVVFAIGFYHASAQGACEETFNVAHSLREEAAYEVISSVDAAECCRACVNLPDCFSYTHKSNEGDDPTCFLHEDELILEDADECQTCISANMPEVFVPLPGSCILQPRSTYSTLNNLQNGRYGSTAVRFSPDELPVDIDITFDLPAQVCALGIAILRPFTGRIEYSTNGDDFILARSFETFYGENRLGFNGFTTAEENLITLSDELGEARVAVLRIVIEEESDREAIPTEVKVWSTPVVECEPFDPFVETLIDNAVSSCADVAEASTCTVECANGFSAGSVDALTYTCGAVDSSLEWIPNFEGEAVCSELTSNFEYFATRLSWEEARDACFERNGDLASSACLRENDVVASTVNATGALSAWVGLIVPVDHDVFIWSDGTDVDFRNNWNDLDADGNEHCGFISAREQNYAEWETDECRVGRSFVCEYPDDEAPSPHCRVPSPPTSGTDDEFVLIMRHKNVTDGFFSEQAIETGIENPDDSEANTYSIIGALDTSSFLLDGARYELQLIYRYNDGSRDVLRWSQESWINNTEIVNADLSAVGDAYFGGSTGFQGLAKTERNNAYLDGSPDHSYWFHAVVTQVGFEGGIPAHEERVAYSSELWILSPSSRDTSDGGDSASGALARQESLGFTMLVITISILLFNY